MIDNNLIPYIEQNLNKGYSASAIQNVLTTQGYPAQNVLDTINYIQYKNQNTSKTGTPSQNSSKKSLFILIPVILMTIIGLFVFFFMNSFPKSISEEDFTQGTNFNLKVNKGLRFNLDQEIHTIKVDFVSDNSVSLTIQSNPIKVDLKIGEEKKFDLDNDSFYDIKIKLNNIADGVPDLYLKKTHESTCVENWNCGNWNDCTEQGTQTRTCTDVNSCGTVKNMDPTSQNCTYVEENIINSNDIMVDLVLDKEEYQALKDPLYGNLSIGYDGDSVGEVLILMNYNYNDTHWLKVVDNVFVDELEGGKIYSDVIREFTIDGDFKNGVAYFGSGSFQDSGNYVYDVLIYDCESVSNLLDKSCEEFVKTKFSEFSDDIGNIFDNLDAMKEFSKSIYVGEFTQAEEPLAFYKDFESCEDNERSLIHKEATFFFPKGDVFEFNIIGYNQTDCMVKMTLIESEKNPPFEGYYTNCGYGNTLSEEYYISSYYLTNYFISDSKFCTGGNLQEYMQFLFKK